ncbi:MAG: septum formation initiator family protein [Minisyncoccia bacterium]
MFDFHEKRKIRSFLYSKVVVGVFFLAAVLLSISVYNRFVVTEEMKAKLDARRVTLEELQGRALMLESKVKYLENDRGVEEELRNRFDVAKEGEKVVILIDPVSGKQKSSTSSVESTETTANTNRSFFGILKFW